MFILQKEHFHRVKTHFSPFQDFLITEAVLSGDNPGKIFVDNIELPAVCFMATTKGCFLFGSTEKTSFNQSLQAYITETLCPELRQKCKTSFDLNVDWSWHNHLEKVFSEADCFPLLGRSFYYRTRSKSDLVNHYELPPGISLHRIDSSLIRENPDNLSILLSVIDEYWPDRVQFLKSGLGFCLVNQESILAWCLPDCTAGRKLEIQVHTLEANRRQGFGSLLTAVTVNAALDSGYQEIGWHCWYENRGSIGVAEKVGFFRESLHRFPVVYLDAVLNLTKRAKLAFQAGQFLTAWEWLQRASTHGRLPVQANILYARVLLRLQQIETARHYFLDAMQQGLDLQNTLQMFPDLQVIAH